jgi:hypothetical protein
MSGSGPQRAWRIKPRIVTARDPGPLPLISCRRFEEINLTMARRAEKRKVLVTGGTSGLGRVIATGFAAAGDDIMPFPPRRVQSRSDSASYTRS